VSITIQPAGDTGYYSNWQTDGVLVEKSKEEGGLLTADKFLVTTDAAAAVGWLHDFYD